MIRPEGIDIIIPIYNAYEDLKKCVASILKNTDLTKHRLIMVNDASPDDRIFPYIQSLKTDNILIVENEKNLGFSGSVNHGMEVSKDRDVILLNSDTLVTRNWVEKIIDCAYSDMTIATVTPLSNNATLCSVPEFLQENTLPEGYTLEKYADLIEMISMRLYPKIPVANGFCIYIKREVIEKIGLFDAETFERGYGEENDFCYRARQIGYRHVMCDDTYIYHTGTTSFISEEKRKLIEAHEKILNDKYPTLNHAVALHCHTNPNENVQENIKIWTRLLNEKKNILYMVQADFRKDAEDNLGGTQLHVKDMTELMCDDYNVFVAARNGAYLNFTAYIEKEEISFKFYIGQPSEYREFRSKKKAELYGKILDAFSIDLVHIHHTKNLSLEMYYEAKLRKIPVAVTLHDYYTVCPMVKMLNCCGTISSSDHAESCQSCYKKLGGVRASTDYASIWRSEHKAALEMADIIFTPSKCAADIVSSYYPAIKSKITVIPHGMDIFEFNSVKSTDNLNVAFVGGISKEKGSYISSQLIKNGPKDVNWYLFGVFGNNELSLLERKNYTKTGPYEREELPQMFEKYSIDLICILPIWPETYSYTLSEAIACNIPVIATDIGALGERIRENNCGWLVSVENAYEETLEIINRIKDKGEEYRNKKSVVCSQKVKTLEDMKKDYEYEYQKLLLSENSRFVIYANLYKFVTDAYRIACKKKISFEAEGDLLQERLEQLESQMNSITNSFTYKCMYALRKLPIPGKRYIKKAIYKLYGFIKRRH